MARFNKKTAETNRMENLAGGEAFIQSPKLEFVSILLTSFVKDQYYRSASDGLKRVKELMSAISDKEFLAKAAVYARTKFGMRSISHAVAAEIAGTVKGQEWTKNFFDKIVYRPDDMTEILAYYYTVYGKNEPNALRKGFANAFSRFDEYHLAKYKREGQEVSLVDVVNLVHPKHTEAISKLVKGTLKPADTWETKLSAAGKAETEEEKDELKGKAWADLIKEKKIGYFALLRNLRNILEQAPDLVDEACALLMDEKMIKKSLVLPFRFLTAGDELRKVNFEGTQKMIVALNEALEISVANVPRFEGKTLIALDVSGSMSGQPAEIARLFSAILLKANAGDADLIEFDNSAEYVTINPMDSLVTIAKSIGGARGGTDLGAPLEEANKKYDRIIYLSDMQGWVGHQAPTSELAAYKSRTGANPRIYSFDLQGYGTMQFPENNVYAIAGFSEKVFDVMKLLEQDRTALVKVIEKVEL